MTEIRRQKNYKIGKRRQPPKNLNFSQVTEKIRSKNFTSALETMAAYQFCHLNQADAHIKQAIHELQNLNSIEFVQELQIIYDLAGHLIPVPVNILNNENRLFLIKLRGGYSELYGFLAQAIADLFTKNSEQKYNFSDTIYRLLRYNSNREMKDYLESRGITWDLHTGVYSFEDEFEDEEYGIGFGETHHIQDNDTDSEKNNHGEETCLNNEAEPEEMCHIEEILLNNLKESMNQKVGGGEIKTGVDEQLEEKPTKENSDITLPPLPSVTPKPLNPSGLWIPQNSQGGRKNRINSWRQPSYHDQVRNEDIGERGEEIVYREELNRVKKIGYPASRVVWTSKSYPGADHDIKSVDDDGNDLWIEVKSTTGKDGRFQWSKNQLKKAIQERGRYILCRVYEVHTRKPTIKRFRDPIHILLTGAMEIEIANLYAEVEPLYSDG